MQNYYRINVSKNGKYLFATEQGCITLDFEAKRLTELLREKFPQSEGYKVSVTKWESKGTTISW